MNQRLETFCDGVFAIAITLLVLDIKVPLVETFHSVGGIWHALGQLWPSFFAFCLSFIIILIAWMGHNNLLKDISNTSPQFHIANGFLMFTIILTPFTTAFMAEYLNTPFGQPAIVVYCLNALLHNIAWNLLHRSIAKPNHLVSDSTVLGLYKKASRGAKYGFFIYASIALLALWLPYLALVITVLTWIYWLWLAVILRHKKMAYN